MDKITNVYKKDNFEFMEHFLRMSIPFEAPFKDDYSEPNQKSSVKGSVKSSIKSLEKILELIKQNPQITLLEIAQVIGISKRAIEKQVSQ